METAWALTARNHECGLSARVCFGGGKTITTGQALHTTTELCGQGELWAVTTASLLWQREWEISWVVLLKHL